jgi:hypothetical protein
MAIEYTVQKLNDTEVEFIWFLEGKEHHRMVTTVRGALNTVKALTPDMYPEMEKYLLGAPVQ